MAAIGPRLRRRGRWLFMVCTREGDAYRVVTVMDTKNPDRIAERRGEKGRWVRIWRGACTTTQRPTSSTYC